jgi:hypothetical protein
MYSVVMKAVLAVVGIVALIAVPTASAHAAPNKYAPVCVTALDAPQWVMTGLDTRLDTVCTSPVPRPLVATALHGRASIDERGVIHYAATDGWVGRDRVTITLPVAGTDGLEARVIVDVYSRPVAVADTYSLPEGVPLVVPAERGLLANDELPGVEGWMIQQGLTPPAHGTVELDAMTGALVYIPEPGFSGRDRFLYRLTGPDDGACSGVAEVTFEVGDSVT